MPAHSARIRIAVVLPLLAAAGAALLVAGSSTHARVAPASDAAPARTAQAPAPALSRNPHPGLGLTGVQNNPIRSTRDFLGERIVLDEDTPMRWFITGFNLEGVHYDGRGTPAPTEIRSSSWEKDRVPEPVRVGRWTPGRGRTGYANGNGGTIWFRLVKAKADGTPDLSQVVASERINAITAYRRSKAEFGTGLTQLIGFQVDRTVPAGEYVAVFGNVSRRPLVHFFSTNLPVHRGSTPNTRNERNPQAPGALGGLDPRETVMWTTSNGRRWAFGSRVGAGPLFGYYDAGSDRRVPWYGWQRAKGQKAVGQQPFIEYGDPRRGLVLRVTAPAAATLTRAGGYAIGSTGVGTVTVRTAAGSASTVTRLGRGLSSALLNRPLPVAAGERYTITATGAIPTARADRYVRATFGSLPWSTNGSPGDRAQLFAE